MNRFEHQAFLAGRYTIRKFLAQASASGYVQAAKNMRKQGFPLAVALYVLIGRVV